MPVEALRGIPWTLLTYAATRVLTVLTTLALARLLAPADFGLFAMATLGMELLSVFSGLWLAAALIVRPDLDRRGEGTVLTLVIAAGVLLALCLSALAPALAAFFGEPRLAGIVLLLAAVLLVSGVNWFYETLLQRELAFRRRFGALVARTLAFSAVALGLAVAGAGVWSLVAAYLAGYLASGAALLMLAPYRVRPAFDREEAGRIVRGGRGFLAQDLAAFLGQNADYVAVGRVLGSAPLGFYAMAFRQAELPNYAIAEPIGKVTFPAFAQMRHRGEDVRPAFLETLRLMALVTLPIGVILSAAAVPFVVALLGPDWKPMAAPLAVLGVWAALRPLQVTIGNLLNSIGRAAVYGRVSLLLLAPLIAATFVAADLGGITAVAWVLLAHMCAISVVLALAAARYGEIPVLAQAKALLPLATAAVVGWGATRAIVSGAGSAPPAATLAAAAGGCLCTYLTAVMLLAPGLLSRALRGAARSVGREPDWQRAVVPAAALATAAVTGALAAAEPKLALAMVFGALLLALPFIAPVPHLLLLVLVTAIVPFDVLNSFAFGGGQGRPGLMASDVLLLGGLARAALVLLDTPLERRPRWAAGGVAVILAVAGLQLVHGLTAGTDAGTSGAELRVLMGFGAAGIALPIVADPAQRAALFKGLIGVGLAIGAWGLVQWTIDIPFTASEDAGVREGVRLDVRRPRTDPGRAVRVPRRGRRGCGGPAVRTGPRHAYARAAGSGRLPQRGRSRPDLRAHLLAGDDRRPGRPRIARELCPEAARPGRRGGGDRRDDRRYGGLDAARPDGGGRAPRVDRRVRLGSLGALPAHGIAPRDRRDPRPAAGWLGARRHHPVGPAIRGRAPVERVVRAQRLPLARVEARPARRGPTGDPDRHRDRVATAARANHDRSRARRCPGVTAASAAREHDLPRLRGARDHGRHGCARRALLRPQGGRGLSGARVRDPPGVPPA